MLDELSRTDFAEHLNTKFRIIFDAEQSLEVELIEITEGTVTPRQEMFSLLFLGPNETPFTQGMCRMEHERMGELSLFLVPVGKDQRGLLYEAVFNRLKEKEQTA